MATRNSNVNFNINIKGVQSARQLSRLLDDILKKLKAVDKFQARTGAGSTGRGKRTRKADVRDRMSKIELGVRRGEIQSVQRLTANYASLVNQINAVGRAGEKTNRMRLQAHKTYTRLSRTIEKQTNELRDLNDAKLRSLSSTDRMRGSLLGRIKTLDLTTKTTNRLENETRRLGTATRQTNAAAHLLLNTGYLIQDSPYGVRGIANNISQMTQSYHQLSMEIAAINAATGSNMTVWASLKKMLRGPTGIILLIGSALPAAIELLSMHWDTLTGSVRNSQEQMESYLKTAKEIRQFHLENNMLGEDVLGIKSRAADLKASKQTVKTLQEVAGLFKELGKLKIGKVRFGKPLTDEIKEVEQEIDSLLKTVGSSFKEVGMGIQNLGFDMVPNFISEWIEKTKKENEELEASIKQRKSSLTDYNKFVLEWSKYMDIQSPKLDLFEFMNEEDQKLLLERTRASIASLTEVITTSLRDGKIKIATAASEYREELSSFIEGTKSEGFFGYQAEMFREVFKRHDEMQKDRLEAEQELLVSSLDFKAMKAEHRIALENSLAGQIDAIRKYYDARERVVRAKELSELETKKELWTLAQEEKERIQGTRDEFHDKELAREQMLQSRKRQLLSNYANFAVLSMQTIAQASDSNARKQFRIQKISSASQAIINGYLAFTKTLASGGALAIPLAYSTLALSIAKAGQIMSQSYDSARATGGGGGGMVSYRGFDFGEQNQGFSQPYMGSSSLGNKPTSGMSPSFPNKVRAVFEDGFGNVVSSGTLQLQRENKEDLGYWSNGK